MDLVLNNWQWLIGFKTTPNQTEMVNKLLKNIPTGNITEPNKLI